MAILSNTLGETALGEFETVHTEVDKTDLFIYGLGVASGNQTAFIHAYIFPIPAFHINSFINGRDNRKSNEDEDWGTEINEEEEIFNEYNPLNNYIKGHINSLEEDTLSFIVNRTNYIDMPTTDGQLDSNTSTVTDYGPYSNHGRLYNGPTWIKGPG